jgi:hypothetical protein
MPPEASVLIDLSKYECNAPYSDYVGMLPEHLYGIQSQRIPGCHGHEHLRGGDL